MPTQTIGPFSRTVNVGRTRVKQTWYRQRPLSSRPLPYTLDKFYDVYGNHASWASWAVSAFPGDYGQSAAKNAAIFRFDEECRGKGVAELGATFATWRQSHEMIVQRAMQLTRAVQAVRRGNLTEAAKILGVGKLKKKKRKKAVRDAAQAWLELSYGWIPLVGDIGNAVEVMQNPGLRSMWLARGRASHQTSYYNSGEVSTYVWKFKTQVAGKVRISNPNLYLANQLGFVNPATIVWEVVPFSFVVDWFVPVGSFLSHWTSRIGLSVEDVYTTDYGVVTHTLHAWGTNPLREHVRVQVVRKTGGVPTPSLTPRFTGFYSLRGANAIALLVSQLKSLK